MIIIMQIANNVFLNVKFVKSLINVLYVKED